MAAESASSRRGLAALVTSADDFELASVGGWDQAVPPGTFLLGELRPQEPIPYLTEPFLLLCDRRDLTLSPGPGRGVVATESEDEVLLAAMRAVRAGLWVTDLIEPELTLPEGPDRLSEREIEILELLAEGLGNRALADSLGISENTVKFHLASIYSKLGASSRTQAVTLGLKNGYLCL